MDLIPNLYALIIGGGGGADLEKSINSSKKHLENFIFTGFIHNDRILKDFYLSSDIFVSPTHSESICFTILEAMSCGVPVIISEKDHDPEIVYMKNALLISDVDDVYEIREKIVLLAKDAHLRKEIALNAKRFVKSKSWKTHLQRFLLGLESLS